MRDQLDLQAPHRVRSRLVGERTAVINPLRGFLLEHGIAVRQGHRFLRQQLPQILADAHRRASLSSIRPCPQQVRCSSDCVQHCRHRGPPICSLAGHRRLVPTYRKSAKPSAYQYSPRHCSRRPPAHVLLTIVAEWNGSPRKNRSAKRASPKSKRTGNHGKGRYPARQS